MKKPKIYCVVLPEGYKINHACIETKSARAQFVFQPSVLDRIKRAAKKRGLSTNEYVHRIMDEVTRDE